MSKKQTQEKPNIEELQSRLREAKRDLQSHNEAFGTLSFTDNMVSLTYNSMIYRIAELQKQINDYYKSNK